MHFFTRHWLWGCFWFIGKNGIMVVWVLNLNFDSKSSEMRSEKSLEFLSPTIPSLSDPSWDRERVSTFLVQTRIGIRLEDLPSLHVRWSHPHIPEWCISFPLDHSRLWESWWIFDVGEWRRGCSYYRNSNLFIHNIWNKIIISILIESIPKSIFVNIVFVCI